MKTVALGDVAEFVRGITFKPDDVVDVGSEGSVGCMRTKNVQAMLDTDDVLGIPTRFVKREEQYLETGDILISSANSWNLLGKCSWVPELPWRSSFGGFVTVLRPHDGAPIDRRYLYRWFSYGRTQQLLRSYGRKTTNISNLPIGRCRKMEIPLPPIEEQRRIAAVLDAADDLRTKCRQALAKLDTLTQAIFIDMFGDPRKNPNGYPVERLGDLALKFSDGPFGSNLKSAHYVESGIRVIRLQNIGVGSFIDKDKAYVSEEHFETIKKHECIPGDVLVGTLGDPNLRACVLPDSVPIAINKADCVQARPDPAKADSHWLVALLNCPETEELAQSMVKGQTRARIAMGRLRELMIPVPHIDKQGEFRQVTGHIAVSKARADTSIDQLDTLFASLQQRAFAGEL